MSQFIKRCILPASVFWVVFAIHYLWLGMFPEDAGTKSWALPEDMPVPTWWQRYTETQSYFLGFSYALSISFVAWALRRYRENQCCKARNLAIGGLSISGFLAVAGCFLLGCCGSPMLAVYLSLFGTAFLPFGKPIVAMLTTVLILAGWGWIRRRVPPQDCKARK